MSLSVKLSQDFTDPTYLVVTVRSDFYLHRSAKQVERGAFAYAFSSMGQKPRYLGTVEQVSGHASQHPLPYGTPAVNPGNYEAGIDTSSLG